MTDVPDYTTFIAELKGTKLAKFYCPCGQELPMREEALYYTCVCGAGYCGYQRPIVQITSKDMIKELEQFIEKTNNLLTKLSAKGVGVIIQVEMEEGKPTMLSINIWRKL